MMDDKIWVGNTLAFRYEMEEAIIAANHYLTKGKGETANP